VIAARGCQRAHVGAYRRAPGSVTLHLGRGGTSCASRKKPTQEQLAFEAEIELTYMGGIERGWKNQSLM